MEGPQQHLFIQSRQESSGAAAAAGWMDGSDRKNNFSAIGMTNLPSKQPSRFTYLDAIRHFFPLRNKSCLYFPSAANIDGHEYK